MSARCWSATGTRSAPPSTRAHASCRTPTAARSSFRRSSATSPARTVPGVTYKDRGRHEFKGWDERWRLYQVVWSGAPVARPRERKRGRLRWWIAAAAVALAAVIAAVIAFSTSGDGHTSLKSLPRNSVGHIDPASDTLDRAIPVPAGPAALASHGTGRTLGRERRRRIGDQDRRANGQPNDHPGRRPPHGDRLADAKGAWVAELANRKLQRVDSQFGHVTLTIGVAAAALALGPDGLYDTVGGATVERRDRATGALVAKRSLDLGAGPLARSRIRLSGSAPIPLSCKLWIRAS